MVALLTALTNRTVATLERVNHVFLGKLDDSEASGGNSLGRMDGRRLLRLTFM